MEVLTNSRFSGTITLLITIFSLSLPAYAKYSGGTGEPNDPYQIATAEDLMLLGETPEDYDKHFILTADIDMDPNLPGRKVFDKAVIAPDINDSEDWFQGIFFTGVFYGNNHVIRNLRIQGEGYLGLFGYLNTGAKISDLSLESANIYGTDYVGGLVGYIHRGKVNRCSSNGSVSSWFGSVGGLVGRNGYGDITMSYSTGTVIGGSTVGGLVGSNNGSITNCYSSCIVTANRTVAGLVGWSTGWVTNCYSVGMVHGSGRNVGGLVGSSSGRDEAYGTAIGSFWDIETSGQPVSFGFGGEGKTTAELQTASTFYHWYRCGEEPIWTIDEGNDYPRLYWENKPGKVIKPISISLSDFLSGAGTKDDPFLIYTPEELNLVSLGMCDWDKHFKLMVDIDLSDYSYDKALIAPETYLTDTEYQGIPFSGVFDGNYQMVSHLKIDGKDYVGLFGQIESGAIVRDLSVVDVNITSSSMYIGGLAGCSKGNIDNCYSSGTVTGGNTIGGLVGRNDGTITMSHSNCEVRGGSSTGGFVGHNVGSITTSYSTGTVSGNNDVGGLVGNFDWDFVGPTPTISRCYSTGLVKGTGWSVGGLVGYNWWGFDVTSSLWDTETSGQQTSDGGTGKTTVEMQSASTFLEVGWDFIDEIENGTDDIWWILEGQDYPRLYWQYGTATSPYPRNGSRETPRSPILHWVPGGRTMQHDIYFGQDINSVANATPETLGVYRGRQMTELITYDPGTLEWGRTYYWRIDEVNEADPNIPLKGEVWSFKTIDYVEVSVVDDFEKYKTEDANDGNSLRETWIFNGAIPIIETQIVHSGRQSMAIYGFAIKSLGRVERMWETPQDWTIDETDALRLYFQGEAYNDLEPLYVIIEDSAGQIADVTHTDANAVLATDWKRWDISLVDLQAQGVDIASVKKMYIGVGDPDMPQSDWAGRIYIDDIRLTNKMP